MTELFEILKVAGPSAPFIFLGLMYARGYIATRREMDQLREELERERTERAAEKAELRQEISYWRNLTWSFSRIADQVAGALPVKADQE